MSCYYNASPESILFPDYISMVMSFFFPVFFLISERKLLVYANGLFLMLFGSFTYRLEAFKKDRLMTKGFLGSGAITTSSKVSYGCLLGIYS